MNEFLIQKDYWGADWDGTDSDLRLNEGANEESFTINILKFNKWQRKGHGEHAVAVYNHIDTIYFEREADRDIEWERMLKDGYMHIKAYQPPALKD